MLWTVSHVLTTEDRLEKLTSNAYAQALKNAWWDKLIGVRAGKGKRDVMEWLLTTAQIHDLPKGTMRYDDLVTQAHEVTHKPRGAGLKIDRDQWEDDEFGFAQDWAAQIGGASAMDPQYAALDLIQAGETGKSYDGVAFFSDSHPVNPFDSSKGTYDNLITDADQMGGASGAPALNATNFKLGVAHMKKFKMPNGRNRNIKPGLLVVGPELEGTALELTSAGFIGATENILTQYRIEPLVINDLGDPNDWFLCAQDGETPGMLPFVRSERRPYAMTSYDGLTQAELNRMNFLEWQLRGRYGHTYGHPYQMVKFKNS